MNKGRIINSIMGGFGLLVAGVLLYGAIHFYHTIHEITKNNPSLNTVRDTLRTITDNDSLVDINASLHQKIAQSLFDKKDEEKIRKQMLLHQTITEFIFVIDTLQTNNISSEETVHRLKNAVNHLNLSCRAALFNIKDLDQIPELNSFMILDEKNLKNTIFECFLNKEIKVQCFEKIKHEALFIEKIILEKNFNQLKT